MNSCEFYNGFCETHNSLRLLLVVLVLLAAHLRVPEQVLGGEVLLVLILLVLLHHLHNPLLLRRVGLQDLLAVRIGLAPLFALPDKRIFSDLVIVQIEFGFR